MKRFTATEKWSDRKAKTKTYAEKLKDPRWQRKRLEIMQRDSFSCCECFSTTKTLNVHHRFYLRGLAPWEYKPAWLETLCEDCHEGREKSIEVIHKSMLHCSTGDLLTWAQRIRKEWEGRRKAYAAKREEPAPEKSQSESERLAASKKAFQMIREAIANG